MNRPKKLQVLHHTRLERLSKGQTLKLIGPIYNARKAFQRQMLLLNGAIRNLQRCWADIFKVQMSGFENFTPQFFLNSLLTIRMLRMNFYVWDTHSLSLSLSLSLSRSLFSISLSHSLSSTHSDKEAHTPIHAFSIENKT